MGEYHGVAAPILAGTTEAMSSEDVDMSGVHLLPVSDLVASDSPRLAGVDEAHVARLAECGARLPPIVVHRQTMRVIDGMHRLRAAARHGREMVEVIFFDGSDHEAFIRAVELNVRHGLPLSLSDRKAAALRILMASVELSDRVIASKAGLSDKTVAAIRRRSGAEIPQADARRGRDGRNYPVSDTEGRERAARLIAERPHASLREIASAASVSPAVVSDVRKRLLAGEDPISAKRRRNRGAANGAPSIFSAMSHSSPAFLARRTGSGDRQPCDKKRVLKQLGSDPSVRDKEAGRELLRWLSGYAIGIDDVPQCADAIPQHRIALVAALARQSASAWLELVRRLENIQRQASVS